MDIMIHGCTMNMAGDLITGVLPTGHGMIPGSGITTGAIPGSMEITGEAGIIPGITAMAGVAGTTPGTIITGVARGMATGARLMFMITVTMVTWAV